MNEDHIELIEKLFKLEGLPYEKITDLAIVMRFTGGKVNPSMNPALIRPVGFADLLLTIYDAVAFIESKGLKRC